MKSIGLSIFPGTKCPQSEESMLNIKYPAYLMNKCNLRIKIELKKLVPFEKRKELDLTGAQSFSDTKYLVIYS